MQDNLGPIIADLAGTTLTKEDKEFLKHPNLGGIILFARNYQNPEQVKALIQDIRRVRPNCFITVDQEGGTVQRFVKGLTTLPNMNCLGLLLKQQKCPLSEVRALAQQLGQLMAMEMISLGVDMSFAPVLDLGTGLNPIVQKRAIDADPKIVSDLGESFIAGMHLSGMKACGKHFPGHGNVLLDSHLALPEDNRTLAEMQEDLYPFQQLIQKGLDSLMTAHIRFPKVDVLPATFSALWLKKILREEWGFNGTIISDDLCMTATHEVGDTVECAHLAIEAGCDYLLICNHRDKAIDALESLKGPFDALSLKRRQALLANKTLPDWPDLKATEGWRLAQNALMQINTLLP